MSAKHRTRPCCVIYACHILQKNNGSGTIKCNGSSPDLKVSDFLRMLFFRHYCCKIHAFGCRYGRGLCTCGMSEGETQDGSSPGGHVKMGIGDELRKVELDVMIPKIVKERAMKLCGEYVQGEHV